MKKIVENLAFDQIYHEHLLYYNLKNIDMLLDRHGLALFDAYLAPIHGGSMIGFVVHQGTKATDSAACSKCARPKSTGAATTLKPIASSPGASKK